MSTIHLIAAYAYSVDVSSQNALKIANDFDVSSLQAALADAQAVELHFPKFTDGRAFSQAVQLRRRHGFKGDIRATGDVLIDQLVQMQRAGFSTAVLRDDQNAAHGQKLLAHYNGFYQGDDQVNIPVNDSLSNQIAAYRGGREKILNAEVTQKTQKREKRNFCF